VQGRRIIQVSWAGTILFGVIALVAAITLGPIRYVAVGVSLGLFAVGCAIFFAAYWTAVQRSRSDEIGIGGLYFLAGSTAPPRVSLLLNGSLLTEVVIALGTSIARPYTTLAFGFLVPVFGLGCTGLWGARYGQFGPRKDPKPITRGRGSPTRSKSRDRPPSAPPAQPPTADAPPSDKAPAEPPTESPPIEPPPSDQAVAEPPPVEPPPADPPPADPPPSDSPPSGPASSEPLDPPPQDPPAEPPPLDPTARPSDALPSTDELPPSRQMTTNEQRASGHLPTDARLASPTAPSPDGAAAGEIGQNARHG
jgi:hypothetical protein